MLKVRVQYTPGHDAFGAFSWRKGGPNTSSARDMLVVINRVTRYHYPYHRVFAYDILNKAAKR